MGFLKETLIYVTVPLEIKMLWWLENYASDSLLDLIAILYTSTPLLGNLKMLSFMLT